MEESGSAPARPGGGGTKAPRLDRQRELDDPRRPGAEPPRSRARPILLIVLLLAAAAGGGWWYWQQANVKPAKVIVAPPPPPPPPTSEAAPTHYPPPVPAEAEQATAKPLPALADSDPTVRDTLAELVGSEALQKLFNTQEIVRHIVVTVDNLPRKSVAVRLNPVKPPGGEFKVSAGAQGSTIGADNALRYAPYVKVGEQVDAKKLVAMYGRTYPLFQQAYEDLGYPKGFFNDRLIAVIDHLLGAPEVSGPIAVVAPHVQYQFADPELEAQSAGRKFLVRIGPENAAVIKAKLREIRRELTRTK